MRLFIERTGGDGMLDTRAYRVRCFAEQLVVAALGPLVVVLVALAYGGGGAMLAFYGGFGALLAFVVASSAKSVRGAALGGAVVGALLLALLVVIHYEFSHPAPD